MVKKFSVGIPDDLAARLEPFKGKYSPTAIFQKAMEEEVDRLELWNSQLPTGDDMDTIVERLRKQKAESENKEYEWGRQEGSQRAKCMSYDSLRSAMRLIREVRDSYRETGYISWDELCRDDDWGEYFSDKEMKDTIVPVEDSSLGELTDTSVKWFEGWSDGVEAFWDSLPEDLRS